MYTEIYGDLIQEALSGKFDVIAHGCNCFCAMGSGIAPQMARAFNVDKFGMERKAFIGDFNKLGQIDWGFVRTNFPAEIIAVNCYTQYAFGRKDHGDGYQAPLDYEALTLCMRKINHTFKGRHIGLPQIGCGLAGGIWDQFELTDEQVRDIEFDLNDFKDVKRIIKQELEDCEVTVVKYKP